MGQADTGKFVKRSAPRGILKHDPTFNGRRYLDMQDDWFANYVDKQRDIGERAEAGADVKAEQEALDASGRSCSRRRPGAARPWRAPACRTVARAGG